MVTNLKAYVYLWVTIWLINWPTMFILATLDGCKWLYMNTYVTDLSIIICVLKHCDNYLMIYWINLGVLLLILQICVVISGVHLAPSQDPICIGQGKNPVLERDDRMAIPVTEMATRMGLKIVWWKRILLPLSEELIQGRFPSCCSSIPSLFSPPIWISIGCDHLQYEYLLVVLMHPYCWEHALLSHLHWILGLLLR